MITSPDLTDKFMNGLKRHGLTYDQIKDNWKYCGGDTGRHLNYFKLCCKDEPLPEHEKECVCGHAIVENCYITFEDDLLILGNCCIKKFIPKSSRTCRDCGKSHKNSVVDRCNNCRAGICDDCEKKCDKKYKKCYKCNHGLSYRFKY
jgi:hypothetical protein